MQNQTRPGMSAFVLDDGVVYHTYSTFSPDSDAEPRQRSSARAALDR
jgi:Bacterial protein of unknown function (DUF899)